MAFSPSRGSRRPQPHSFLFFSVKQKSLEVHVGRDGEGHRVREELCTSNQSFLVTLL